MRKCFVFLVVVIALSLVRQASADDAVMTGGYFLDACSAPKSYKASEKKGALEWMCEGLTIGLLHGSNIAQIMSSSNSASEEELKAIKNNEPDSYETILKINQRFSVYCKPEMVTPKQARGVLLKYLETHPESLHERFEVLFMRAMQEAFPCPSKN
jgi:hypothetical protein